MIKRTNEELKQRLNMEFVGKSKDYQLEKATIAFETSQLEYDMAIKESRRQIAAVESYYGKKTPHSDKTDEELVVHLYEKGFELMIELMIERTEELEYLVKQREE